MRPVAGAPRWLPIAVLLPVLCIALLGAGRDALAHAGLERVQPADGAVVAAAPAAFAITFNEPTAPLVVSLVRPDGSRLRLTGIARDDTTLRIPAPPGLANGTYVLSWRVVSADGHPVAGSAVFSVGAPSAAAAPAAARVDWPLRAAIWAARVVLYGGLFFGVGGAVFLCWIGDGAPSAGPVVRGALVAGLVAAPLSLGLQGLDALGLAFHALAQPATWRAGWTTSYGATALGTADAMLAGLLALARPGRLGRPLSLVALIAAGCAMAASGHAGTAPPRWLTRPAVFLHVVGIAAWLGALAPLGAALATGRRDGGALLGGFSRAIPFAVLPLTAAGILLAVVQVGHVAALWTTAYGRVLLAKLALLVVLFGLAVLNRFWLTVPAGRGEARAIRRLRRSITAEIGLAAAILAVAALWRFTPPPRLLVAPPAIVHLNGTSAAATLGIAPGRVGPATASITLRDRHGMPLTPLAVTLVLANPRAGIEAARRAADRAGDGTWRVDALAVPVAGTWSVRIEVLVSTFELETLEGTVAISSGPRAGSE